ncbi:hypothetical protein KRX19_05520 [Cardiobacteriaceae bacterium TAE3-ERU3]|nr:hypothetical protein [Cardiobacteriaceae bacterium TAE3-ERU3]
MNEQPAEQFNYDLERIKERVEGEFVEMPDCTLTDRESFIKWLEEQ